MASPIADLSYRNYDGPLAPPLYRWWVIAKQTFLLGIKRKQFWWLTIISSGYYVAMIFVLYFMDQQSSTLMGPQGQPMVNQFMKGIVWKDQFLHGWSMGQLWLFMLALLVGAGVIANDMRANALLVYLSKPCDKRDYLLGKWFGVFMTLLLVMAVPTFFFFGYAALSYAEFGFFSQDRLLFFKLLLMLPLGAAFYSSLIIGVSSMFKQGRIAGAVLAAIYFLTSFFTKGMEIAYREAHGAPAAARATMGKLYYASVDGVQIGMAKSVLGTDGSLPFGIQARGIAEIPAPSFWLMILVMTVLSAGFLFIAWRQIRPVEVVG
ncbi:MAG: ABC transporter permease subunit [Armatimonadetes bacterium]|nr:ABC transporter permease subunit [Armatimonadota bacterium]